jgi:hypothetical protein
MSPTSTAIATRTRKVNTSAPIPQTPTLTTTSFKLGV